MNIKDRVVFITGANRGIGRALVKSCIAAGAATVYAAARNAETVDSSLGDRIIPVKLDVTQPQSVAAAATFAADVSILFNNAGVLDFGDIMSVTKSQIRRNFDVNFFGALAVARAFAPVIESNGPGAIVNTLTLLSLASMPGLSAYNASKAAAWSMHLSLRATLANRKVNLHGVFPGAVDTDMLAGVEIPKTSAQDVANAVVEGVLNGQEDIFPDSMSRQVYAEWRQDHKSVERQFADM